MYFYCYWSIRLNCWLWDVMALFYVLKTDALIASFVFPFKIKLKRVWLLFLIRERSWASRPSLTSNRRAEVEQHTRWREEIEGRTRQRRSKKIRRSVQGYEEVLLCRKLLGPGNPDAPNFSASIYFLSVRAKCQIIFSLPNIPFVARCQQLTLKATQYRFGREWWWPRKLLKRPRLRPRNKGGQRKKGEGWKKRQFGSCIWGTKHWRSTCNCFWLWLYCPWDSDCKC